MLDSLKRGFKPALLLSAVLLCLPTFSPFAAGTQDWVWTRETVDSSGEAMSLAADPAGNIHLSYGGQGGLRYGYRPAGLKSHWFTMALGGGVSYTNIKADLNGNPHLCATYLSLPLRYAHYDGKRWDIQPIAPEDTMSVQAQCSVAISKDGTPHVAWYRLPGGFGNNHIRYAVLKDGAWLMQTLDFDEQSGKWNWMVADQSGNPDVSYDAYVKGELKFAHWDGKDWNKQIVDHRGAHGADYSLGEGSSLALDAKGHGHISYYSDTELRYASQEGDTWKVETVEKIQPTGAFVDYRSTLLFDKDGVPHISYEDLGVVKHAFKIGDEWQVQVIAPRGATTSRYNSMAIDVASDLIYIAYVDPLDSSLKVAVGRRAPASEAAPAPRTAKN